MKTWKIIGIGITLLLIAGCIEYETPASEDKTFGDRLINELIVFSKCNDRVVCYYHPDGYAGGMSCFRDAELANKYC